MAEMLVQIAAPNGEPSPEGILPGEVVTVAADGHSWSETEQTNPRWQVVAIPGVPPENLSRLTNVYTDAEIELLKAGTWDGRLAQFRRRAYIVDIQVLFALLSNAEASAAFLANPTWEEAFSLGLVKQWDAQA